MDPRTILTNILKGSIAPEDLSIGGTLDPEIASKFIDLVVSQSALLQRVTVQKKLKLTGYIKLLDIADEVLVRVAEGTEPSAGQLTEPTKTDVPYDNKYVQLFYQLLFSTIADNQRNPNFESDLETMFAKKFANELVRLGFRGVADNYAASAWSALNKGWIQVAKENAPAGQQVNTNGLPDISDRLDALIEATPSQYKQPGKTTLILSVTDHESLAKELGTSAASILAQIILSGELPRFRGYPFMTDPQAVDSEYLFTDPSNMIMTMLTEIERFREVRGTKRCIDYTFNLANDYLFGNPKAVTVGWDQGAE